MPASIICRMVSSFSVAGPSVQTIFVFRIMSNLDFCDDESVKYILKINPLYMIL